jgi:hypothetical protein
MHHFAVLDIGLVKDPINIFQDPQQCLEPERKSFSYLKEIVWQAYNVIKCNMIIQTLKAFKKVEVFI